MAVKLALGGCAVALVALAFWWPGAGTAPALPPAATANEPAIAVHADAGAHTTDRSPMEPAVPVPTEDVPAVAIVRGRCVDAAGTPLPDCEVRVRGVAGGAGRALRWQQRHGPFAWRDPAAVRSDGEGRFVVEVPPTGPLVAELVVMADRRTAATWRWAQLRIGDVRDVGDVVVRRLVQVHLQVENRSGQPLPWLPLRFVLNEEGRDEARRRLERTTHTDARGSATLTLAEGDHAARTMKILADGARIGLLSLSVPGDKPEFSTTLVIDTAPSTEIITGLVVDVQGMPVAGARLSATYFDAARADQWTPFETATTGEGRFVLGRPSADLWSGDLILHCAATGYDQTASPSLQWGARDVQIVLAPANAMHVVVHGPSGKSVTDFDLTLELRTRYPRRSEERFEAGPHPGGVVVCDDLPRGDYELTIEPHDPSLCARYAMPLVVDGGGTGIVDVELVLAVTRVLKVQTPDGRPVAAARFERLANTLRDQPQHPGVASRSISFQSSRRAYGDNQVLGYQEGETDTEGTALLRGPAGQLFAVRVSGAGTLPLVVPEVDLGDDEPLVVTVDRGASLRGRVGPAAFMAATRQFVRGEQEEEEQDEELAVLLRSLGADTSVRLVLRDGASRRGAAAPIADDGAFLVEGMTAGTWTVSLQARNAIEGNMAFALGTVEVAEGASVERDFDLTAQIPARLRGTVSIDGAPAAGKLYLVDTGQTQRVSTEVDSDGAFDAWVAPGEVAIDYHSRGDAPLRLRLAGRYVVAPGADLTPVFTVSTGELRMRLVDPAGAPVPDLWVRWHDAAAARSGAARSDAAGVVTERVAIGTFALQCLPRSLQDESARDRFTQEHRGDADALERQYVELGVITVLPGDQRVHTIVLPPQWDR